jgi:hypothetical protein
VKIVIVYIYPLDGQEGFDLKANRFIDSYLRNPPGLAHDTVIVCNGGPAYYAVEHRFSYLPNVQLLENNNRGKDIGGYLAAAKKVPADLMVFFGACSYFRKPEWLVPVLRSYFRKGNTLYGATSHPGEGNHIHPHIRTTGFWLKPELLTQYCPDGIDNDRRYELEHGQTCLTNWFRNHGMTPWVVTYGGEYRVEQSREIPNGYHNGDQSNVLFGDRLTEPPNHDDPLAIVS